MDDMDTSTLREESGMPVVMMHGVRNAEAGDGMVYHIRCRQLVRSCQRPAQDLTLLAWLDGM